MMHMWFWFGSKLGDFLLPGYNVVTTTSFFCTCLGLTALAILYEGMKILQIKLQQSATMLIRKQTARTSENSSLLSKISSKSFGMHLSSHCTYWSAWSFQVLHWSLRTFLGYLLMLAVMSYNVYINIAVVLGGGLGYWVFGPKLIELNMKQFYDKRNILDCDKECADNAINYEGQGSTVSVVSEHLITEATIEVHVPRNV